MKGIRYILLCLSCFAGLFTKASAPVNLEFDIKGMPDGYCKLIGMVGNNNYIVDSFRAVHGKAVFRKDELLKGGMYYFTLPERGFLQLLLDKDQDAVFKTDTAELVRHMEVSGNEDNELLYNNLKYELSFRERLDSIEAALKKESTAAGRMGLETKKMQLIDERKAYIKALPLDHPNSFFTHFKIAGQNPELQYPKNPDGTLDSTRQIILYRDAYWDNTPVNEEKLLRTPVVANKLKTYMTQLLPQNADSILKYAIPLIEKTRSCPECFKFFVNWIAINYQKHTFMGDEKILVDLADRYFTDSIAGPWFKDNPAELIRIQLRVKDMRPSLIGMKGQDLKCRDLNGNYESLYDLKTPIKIVFMYNPDCSHCQEQTPQLKALVDRWKGKVDVYALDLEKEEDKWRAFVKDYGIESFHNVIDPKMESLFYKKYHVENTPGIFILDKNNIIVAKDLHPNQLDEVFQDVLSKQGDR